MKNGKNKVELMCSNLFPIYIMFLRLLPEPGISIQMGKKS